MINTAIVGYGYSAKTFHIPFLMTLKSFNFYAINSSKRQVLAAEHPSVLCYDGLEPMLADDNIELVIITSPNDTHFSIAKACLEANKHVIIEKPFVTNSEDGLALISLAEKNKLVLAVFHNRRWDGDFLTVKSIIENKTLGKIRLYESHFDRFRPQVRQRWREQPGDGAGIWFDLGPHLVDQAFVLFGIPEAVTPSCRSLRQNSRTTDYFHVLLHYREHEVILHSSPFCAGETLRFHIQGDKGSYLKMGLDPQEDALKAGILPGTEQWLTEIRDQNGTIYLEDTDTSTKTGKETTIETRRGNYQALFENVSEAIERGAPLEVTALEALEGIKLLEMKNSSVHVNK